VVEGVIAALGEADGALPAVPVSDTIKRSLDGHTIVATEDRRTLFAAQTPQGFRFPQIFSAHMRASTLPREFTDDAAIAEWAGLHVVLTPGETGNIKLTQPEDFERAERMIGGGVGAMETRVGQGVDVHPFGPGDHVVLGGVRIPNERGLVGHSDADAALHALCDAIYGALGVGDIGTHFPPSDPKWRGAASTVFLEHAAGLVADRGGRIVNLDLTLVCETPRISPHAGAMREIIAATCGIAASRVAIKATTSEKLGLPDAAKASSRSPPPALNCRSTRERPTRRDAAASSDRAAADHRHGGKLYGRTDRRRSDGNSRIVGSSVGRLRDLRQRRQDADDRRAGGADRGARRGFRAGGACDG
jgi:2-C-methyl-D-erythritol 4-phosphate cytidylyltransferase/2-C-methyl-D-erythritol 2,4-cyclodiphosphate synthase